jgi:hypothetical protein
VSVFSVRSAVLNREQKCLCSLLGPRHQTETEVPVFSVRSAALNREQKCLCSLLGPRH